MGLSNALLLPGCRRTRGSAEARQIAVALETAGRDYNKALVRSWGDILDRGELDKLRTLFAAGLCALTVALGGCASPPGPSASQPRTAHPSEAASCDEALLYETADAHPAIRWISVRPGRSANPALSCLLESDADDGTIEMAAYMSSGLYRFIRECRPGDRRIYRLFEYKNRKRPYLLRLHANQYLDPKSYVVVGSYRKPAGNYQHGIAERSNEASSIRLCPPESMSSK